MTTQTAQTHKRAEPDWLRLRNYLARKALDTQPDVPRGEVYSLAGLALAMARREHRQRRATGPLGKWICSCGWRHLRSLLRDEARRRGREPRVIAFTDLGGRQAAPRRIAKADYAAETALARRVRPPSVADWMDRLSVEERRIVRMLAGGWTMEEVAWVHDETVPTLRSRLKDLQRRLADVAPPPRPGRRSP